ncbi:PilW family protein [Metapseudomonas boanensis]|uniref:PilW family protein n=1 Tax=Metapseudomonas boanensis TaxID=2822138 RepID=A0ABS5XPG2_9GAMM|nr:PilW family protein [Pseudomonas boanensis]MBT8768996.1 PilW family protein [Pseudomonas boanensis]
MSLAKSPMISQKGFSIVEIMIAMTLGLVILIAVTEIFLKDNQVRTEIDRTGRQIENGNYVLRLLEDELENAGYWGEAGAQTLPASVPPLCPTSESDLEAAMGYPVQGALGGGTNCSSPKSGTDFIAIRRASTCALGSPGCALAGANFHIQVSACKSLAPGELKLSANTGDLDLKARDCTALAPRYQMLSRVYFVSSSDVLMRAELLGNDYSTVTSLVDDIEIIRFEYGLDTTGDGTVDSFTRTPAGAQWADVVSVKVYLIARNPEPTSGYTDDNDYVLAGVTYVVPDSLKGYKRQLYSTTVHLRNVAGRRELP